MLENTELVTLNPRFYSCVAYSYHSPRPMILHAHHVIPKAWTKALDQPDSRTVPLCPTCHDNVHVAIRLRLKNETLPRAIRSATFIALVDEAIEWKERTFGPEMSTLLERVLNV